MHLKETKAHWKKFTDDADGVAELANQAASVLEIVVSDSVVLDNFDPQNRWGMMKSDAALASYVLDPEVFDKSPWTHPDAMAVLVRVVESILGTNRETGEYELERMEEMISKFYVQFSKY